MATGFMARLGNRWKAVHFTSALLGCLVALPVAAQEVGLAGVIGSKALLMINGAPPRSVPLGTTIDGIKVVAVQGDQVIVEIGGKKRPLRVGQHAVGNAADSGAELVTLNADSQGHFVTNGTVNGGSVRFVVDTGASLVSLGASDARRLGIDPAKGERGVSQTANGQTQISIVKLNSVRIGGITLHQVDAAIHQNDLPVALLGMSFLNRMEMKRDGDTMTLKKRF